MESTQLRLLLVRHGQSEWNAAGRLQGQTEHVGLTELGRRQARAAAEHLAGERVDTLLTSDLARAAQTAAAVADTTGLTAVRDARLREQCHGVLEGRSLSEAEHARIRAAGPSERIGGGESLDDVRRRVIPLLRVYVDAACDGRGIVLVTHGETIRAALAWLTSTASPELPPNGSITTVCLTGGVLTERYTVVPSLGAPVGVARAVSGRRGQP